jgi:hypothetical protein
MTATPGGQPAAQARGGPSAGAFLAELARFLGDPYVYGAAGPSAFDCSGLVQYAAAKIGITLPRTSEAQYAAVEHITAAQLRPGDLIFEQWPGDNSPPGHVAIYTGNGKIEEAAQTGIPVHIVAWSPGEVSAQGGRVVGYGRIPGLSGSGGGGPVLTSFPGSGLLGVPGDVVHAFTSAGTALDWLLQPGHWVRIICGALGLGAVGGGVLMLGHTGGDAGEGGSMVPRAASLPLGILLTGTGGVLLFVAFHNLPSSVVDLPTLLAYLVESIQGKTPKSSGSGSGSGSGGGGLVLPPLPGFPPVEIPL